MIESLFPPADYWLLRARARVLIPQCSTVGGDDARREADTGGRMLQYSTTRAVWAVIFLVLSRT